MSETPASAYRAGLARQAGTVVVALRATQCQKHYADEQVAVIHAYREKTLFAGPGLMLGGLALGGAGAGLFVNAKGQPETCADGDDNCVSRDEMVGYGVIASGLGAASLIVGTYNAFKGRVSVADDQQVVASQPRTETCTLATQGVDVALSNGATVLASGRTDAAGFAVWNVPDRDLARWPFTVTLTIDHTSTISFDDSAAVRTAIARVDEELQRELEATARANRSVAPPELVPRQAPARPGGQGSGWLYSTRALARDVLKRHPRECQWIVGQAEAQLVAGVFTEERAAAYILEQIFGQDMAEYWASWAVSALHGFFPDFFGQIEQLLGELKSQTSALACEALTDLIDPDKRW